MEFTEIFEQFLEYHDRLKVIFIGSSDENGQPNCVPKMLIDIAKPNKVFYIDTITSRTYRNIQQNWQSAIAFIYSKTFTGFRLTGFSQVIDSGHEFMMMKKKWTNKAIGYEAERMIERIKGVFSGRPPEVSLPDDYVIMKFIAEEAAIVKPDRILKAMRRPKQEDLGSPSHPIKKIVELEAELTEHIRMEKKIEKRERELEKASVEDDLTGLYNRRGFATLVEQQLKIAKRSGKNSFLIFSDLDRLKPINDAFGHKAGDEAIVDAAEVLKKTFRESDIIGRIGGDEFAVAVIDCEQEYLDNVTSRLKKNLDEYNYAKKDSPYVLGLSLGVAICKPDESVSLEELLNRADHQMYEEKNKKKQLS